MKLGAVLILLAKVSNTWPVILNVKFALLNTKLLIFVNILQDNQASWYQKLNFGL